MLHLIILLDGTETAIQNVLWAVLAVFSVMVILGWLVASKEWEEEEKSMAAEEQEEFTP